MLRRCRLSVALPARLGAARTAHTSRLGGWTRASAIRSLGWSARRSQCPVALALLLVSRDEGGYLMGAGWVHWLACAG
eukprot:7590656-Pyramimonas_sp.AAC.1